MRGYGKKRGIRTVSGRKGYGGEKKTSNRTEMMVRLLFTCMHPNAKEVQVAGAGGYFSNEKITLESDGRGGFCRTVPKMHWAMHYYFWFVDGRACL